MSAMDFSWKESRVGKSIDPNKEWTSENGEQSPWNMNTLVLGFLLNY